MGKLRISIELPLEISLAEFLAFMARHRISPFVLTEHELAQESERSKRGSCVTQAP